MQETLVVLIPQLIILILGMGLLYTIRYGMNRALQKAGYSEVARYRLVRSVQVGLYFWLILVALDSIQGWLPRTGGFPEQLLYWLLPPLLTISALVFSPRARTWLKHIPESWLIYAQSFRFLLDLFFYLGYKVGLVPLQMTFLWLNYDFTVGLTAPLAGYVFFGKNRYHRFEAILWNSFGLVLLFYNFGIALVSFPGPQQVFLRTPDSSFLDGFPFAWIVAFFLPFACLLHVLSLKRLLQSARPHKRTFTLNR